MENSGTTKRIWLIRMYGKASKGGAVFLNAKKYYQAGMDNENFYGWGNEDDLAFQYKLPKVEKELDTPVFYVRTRKMQVLYKNMALSSGN